MTNPTAFTPEELADRLDYLLANPQPPVDDPLLQAASRLINVRQPVLSAAAFERIQQQLMTAAEQPPSLRTRILQSPVLLVTTIVIVVVIVILVMVWIVGAIQNQNAAHTTAATDIPTAHMIVTEPIATAQNQAVALTPITETPTEPVSLTPSATLTRTATSVPPSITPVVPTETAAVTNTQTPEASSTMTASFTATMPPDTAAPMPTTMIPTETAAAAQVEASPTPETPTPTPSQTPAAANATATPTATRTAAPLTLMVIEGAVEAINVNQIVIFGIPIMLDPNSPFLASLRVGDEVRIEAVVVTSGSVIIVSAVTFEFTSEDIFVNDATGEVYRDNSSSGDCSNPPPSWVPAAGWRARCEGGAAPGNSGGSPGSSGSNPDNSSGMGMGDSGSGS